VLQITGTGVVSRAVVRITPRDEAETDGLVFDQGSILSAEGPELEFSQSADSAQVQFDAGLSQGNPAIFQKAFRAISYQNQVSRCRQPLTHHRPLIQKQKTHTSQRPLGQAIAPFSRPDQTLTRRRWVRSWNSHRARW
jgi:hypothetical protein